MKYKLLDLLAQRCIPLFGAARPDVPAEVHSHSSPDSILREARSVLCYAIPIPKGLLLAGANSSLLFWRFSNMTYRLLDTVSNEICTLLEDQGHLAAPIYSCFPWKLHENRFYGLLSLVNWSQECGIGKITRSGLIGNARFGTRLLLGGVITSAYLEESGKMTAEVCPPECIICQESCPVKAIAKNGKVDHNLCIRYSGANPLLAHLLADREMKTRFGFETLLNTVSVDDHGMYTCSKCLESCPLNR